MDLQDRKRHHADTYHLHDGEMMHTLDQVKALCVTKYCLRFPTPFDLQTCNGKVDQARKYRSDYGLSDIHKLVGIVGTMGLNHKYGTIVESLTRANIPFIKEVDGRNSISKTCAFFSQISVAIAWSPHIVTPAQLNNSRPIDYKMIDYWHLQKPAERFTNPIIFGIPTIGYSKYSSYRAYGTELLCDSDECALDLIERIHRRDPDIVAAQALVTKRVRRDLNDERIGLVLRTFLMDALNWKQFKLLHNGTAAASYPGTPQIIQNADV